MAASTNRTMNYGLLVMRLGIGLLFLKYGLEKLSGGPDQWRELGGAMQVFGIGFAPTFWGFMAAFSEAAGGVSLVLGLLFRPLNILLFITMLVATVMKFSGDGFGAAGYPLAMTIVIAGFLVSGPGRLALGNTVSFLRDKWYQ